MRPPSPAQESAPPTVRLQFAGKRVAIVHEWIAARAGSEKVFERLASLVPEAELFCLSYQPAVELLLGRRPLRTTFLDYPFLRRYRALTLPLMVPAWRSLRREGFDIVISSTHALCRSFFDPSRDGVHLSYVHAPMRYAWTREIDERRRLPGANQAAAVLRTLDRSTVGGVRSFACNSTATQARILRYYKRHADVIHPPVDVAYFRHRSERHRSYLLAVGRWVMYKRFDLAIEVAATLNRRLVIAGSGPMEKPLRQKASTSTGRVDFVKGPSDAMLRHLYAGAAVLLFPGTEDFGMIPVEAQAAGTPVVGVRDGGLVDTVQHGVTGWLTSDRNPESFVDAVRLCQDIDPESCVEWSQRFAPEVFDEGITKWIDSSLLHPTDPTAGRIASPRNSGPGEEASN